MRLRPLSPTRACTLLTVLCLQNLPCVPARAQQAAGVQQGREALIAPARPVPVGKAPRMEVRQIRSVPGEAVYVLVFHQGDEALSGLTDFAIANNIQDAHFTGIGAVSGATLAWLNLGLKQYRAIPVATQHEVLSLTGDIAVSQGKPIVHMHAVLGGRDGSTVGGHVFALVVEPTLEVFLTADTLPLQKKPDPASGIKLIDPTR